MVTFCDELISFLQEKDGCLSPTAVGISGSELEKFKAEVYKLFDDYCSVVYIPVAGVCLDPESAVLLSDTAKTSI